MFTEELYVHIFLMSYDNQAMTKAAHGGHGHEICMGILGGIFSQENTLEVCTKFIFAIQTSKWENGDHLE